MANTLQDFIDDLTPIIRDVTDINFVPDDPQEELTVFPACVVYPTSGGVIYGVKPDARYYHNITIAVLTQLNVIGLGHAHRIITPKLETIADTIYNKIDDGTLTGLENIPRMSYTFQPVEWAAQPLFGFFLTLEEVKIRRTRTNA